MASQSPDDKAIPWEEGNIAYHELYTVASEAVARFAHP